MKLSAMKVDPALSEQGDWVDNIPDLPGIRIKARGSNNSDYRALEAKLVREIPRAERIEGVSPKEQDRIAGQLLLQTVVLDVESLEGDDGQPLKYTRELARSSCSIPSFASSRRVLPMPARSSHSAARPTRSSTQKTDRCPGLRLDWGETYETIVAAAQSAGVPLRMLPCVVTRADPRSYRPSIRPSPALRRRSCRACCQRCALSPVVSFLQMAEGVLAKGAQVAGNGHGPIAALPGAGGTIADT
jgi:hypothetical protein